MPSHIFESLANHHFAGKDFFHADATSPNAMVVDQPDELAVESSDKDDVALISTDEAEPEVPAPPVATDCTSSPPVTYAVGRPSLTLGDR